jgi:hypothetical protein
VIFLDRISSVDPIAYQAVAAGKHGGGQIAMY